MADENRKLIFEIEFDTQKQVAEAAKLRQAIDEDKKALAEVNKQIKLNGDASGELAKKATELEINIQKNVKARNTEIKTIDNYTKATKNAIGSNNEYNGSINNLRGNLAFLTEKWNGLSKAERENVAIGGVLQKEIKSTSDELKQLEGSVGDNRRGVGGYLDAIKQAPGIMGKMKAGVNGISTALTASPLGLLTTILPQIIALFNSSGEGADFFAKIMGGVNAVLQVGMKYLVKFGGYLVDAGKAAMTAFSSPKKILSDLVDFMKTNLINRFKAFAVILEGIKTMDFRKVTDGVIQMGTGITDASKKAQDFANKAGNGIKQFGKDIQDAANAGASLEEQLDNLAKRERELSVEASNTRKEINQLSIQARSRALSEEQKLKLLDKADKLQLSLNDKQLKLERDRLALLQKQNQLSQEDSDVQEERITEQLTKINELEEAGQNIREKFQVRKDALADKAAAAEAARREKSAAAEKKYNEDREKALIQIVDFEAALEKIKADKAKEIEDARKTALQKQFEANEKVRQQTEKDDAARRKQEEIDANKAIELKQKEHTALVNLSDATSNLFAALAEESSTFAEFQKALTLFKIGLASAEAISKGIAASQDVGFPGNLIAMATTVATVAANLLQAKKLIDGDVPKAPKAKAAEGGLLVGPSHDSGGISGTGSFAGIEVEGGEVIINKKSSAMFAPLLSMINQMGGGRALASTTYAAAGGYLNPTLPATTRNYINNTGLPTIDYNQLARAMAKMPAPVVSVKRIEAVQAQHQVTVKRATIG